jgi:hypothetical protein
LSASKENRVSVAVAARYILFICPRQVRRMCFDGTFKTAAKRGKDRGWWTISREEVEQHKNRKRDIYA